MEKLVVIKPIKKARWAPMARYMKCRDTIAPYLSPKGGVETGLTKDEEAYFEKALGMPAGSLSRTSKFWQDYKIDMTDQSKLLYTDTPEGELAYKFILSHKRVANSVAERTDWPYAEYVIEDVEEEAKQENAKSRRKIEALKRFDKLSLEEMRMILKVIGRFTPEKTSNQVVEKAVRELAENDHNRFLDILDDKHFTTKALIEDLIRIKALRRNANIIMFGDTPIGHDMESTVIFLEDPMNQAVRLQLERQLQGISKADVEKREPKKESTKA